MITVDLADHRSSGARVFAGQDRGASVRESARLAQADADGLRVRIVIPGDVYSINASFLLGLLGASIRALGAEEFESRYSFEGEGMTPVVRQVLDAAIADALKTDSPFRRG